MKTRTWKTLVLWPFLFWILAGGAGAAASWSVTELELGGRTLQIEIAADEATRRQGLMHRESLAADHGMLFIWPRPAQYAMWMQNTLIALDVAFIDADFRITNIRTMEPRTTTLHYATQEVLYALEMPAGWFEAHQVRPGQRVPALQAIAAEYPGR